VFFSSPPYYFHFLILFCSSLKKEKWKGKKLKKLLPSITTLEATNSKEKHTKKGISFRYCLSIAQNYQNINAFISTVYCGN